MVSSNQIAMSEDLSSITEHSVYVSYATEELDTAAWVQGFIANLEDMDIRCWCRDLIRVGDHRDAKSNAQIKKSYGVILVISPGTPCSDDCVFDMAAAKRYRKKIYPILLWDSNYVNQTILPGIARINFSHYNRNSDQIFYRKNISALSQEIKQKAVDESILNKIEIPERCSSYVDASLWMSALNLVGFCYQFNCVLPVGVYENSKNLM